MPRPVSPPPDVYAVLGVSPTADQATLKAAHRRLAWEHHPDRVPAAEREAATRRIQQINVAYGLVRTPAARARYDRLRRAGRPGLWRNGGTAVKHDASAALSTEWDELM